MSHICFRDLCHTFATSAQENGMDVKDLSDIRVHVSAATTLDIYTYITDPMQSEAVAKIAQRIWKSSSVGITCGAIRDTNNDHIPAPYRRKNGGLTSGVSLRSARTAGRDATPLYGRTVRRTLKMCMLTLARNVRKNSRC